MSARLDPIDTLSACERDDLRAFASGLAAKEIADARGCTVRTIDKELERAREKLGVTKTVAAAVMLALHEDRCERGVKIRTTAGFTPRPRRSHHARRPKPCRKRPAPKLEPKPACKRKPARPVPPKAGPHRKGSRR